MPDGLALSCVLAQALAQAEMAGLRCVQQFRRRLDGAWKPDWLADVYVFTHATDS